MDHAEAVGDEGVGELRELVGERGPDRVVLAGLAVVEADVLQQGDVTVTEALDRLRGARADGVGREGHRPASSSESRSATGRRVYAGSGAPFGRPRWAVTTTRAPRLGELLDGRDARADPTVVGDGGAVEGHVEVRADQDALALSSPSDSMPAVVGHRLRGRSRRA